MRVIEAIETHGQPAWIAYASRADRDQIPKGAWTQLLAGAKTSPAFIKRADKYEAIFEFIADKLFEEVTPKQVGDAVEMGASTVRKFMEERPDLFRPMRRGVYEVRDERADRKADRG